ncbi:hypothetical protein MATL_G00093870 [Megalops atlanticus]|uniref:EF-hand domain-containing protein n=1 Tax=Megalops atlanticus TaxID=7932 RepID=A0A9D3Q2G7_MEGAT|nr:hypothetical protein MATL_G00093870 [Megalops atlanticus]
MDRSELQRLFSACDVNKSGKIEYEDFKAVCRELNVPTTEVKSLFKEFDVDEVGYVDFGDFSARFNELSETLDFTELGEVAQNQRSAWDEFEDTMDGEITVLGSIRDQLAEVYQQIHSTSDFALLCQFEALIKVLVNKSKDQLIDNQRLETSFRRLEKMTARQLAELEDEFTEIEDRERQKMEATLDEMQKSHNSEVAELRATLERLRRYQEESQHESSRMDMHKLKSQLRQKTQENEQLKSSLLSAQVNLSVLRGAGSAEE